MFNEMLMRDFGFRIYKMLERTPDKVQEFKEKVTDKSGRYRKMIKTGY